MIKPFRRLKIWQISRNGYDYKYYFAVAHYFFGEVALKKPFHSMHHNTLKKASTIFQAIKAEYYLARAYAGYGRYYNKQKGDIAQAREYLTKALEIFTRLEP